MFLLDTNACIRILNASSARLIAQLHQHEPDEIAVSAITRAELLYGARKSARVTENLGVLTRFLAACVSLAFDERCAEHYGAIRADLAVRGKRIGPNDLLIAATARAHDATLVTHNTREFCRIVGLKVEDWERESLA